MIPHEYTCIKRLSKYMQRVESGERMANMRWCRRHIFVVISNDKEGLHWFVCAFDCRVRLELFTIWVWEPLSSTDLIRSFLSPLKKSSQTTSVQATPTPLEGKEASAEQSVESPEARPQPSMATPTEEEDTHPKVLIRGEWRKVPDGYPADACGQLERDQLFIDDLCKQLVAELRAACKFNPNPGAKPKSGDTKTDLIYKRAFCNYL